MYALIFELDDSTLQIAYPVTPGESPVVDIYKVLTQSGFSWQKSGIYFGGPNTSAVDCVLAVQRLVKYLPWFGRAVRGLKMLRIDEVSDLSSILLEEKSHG